MSSVCSALRASIARSANASSPSATSLKPELPGRAAICSSHSPDNDSAGGPAYALDGVRATFSSRLTQPLADTATLVASSTEARNFAADLTIGDSEMAVACGDAPGSLFRYILFPRIHAVTRGLA